MRRSVERSWEKHGPLPEGSATAVGVIAGIQVVRYRLAPMTGDASTMVHPVEGSGPLEVCTLRMDVMRRGWP